MLLQDLTDKFKDLPFCAPGPEVARTGSGLRGEIGQPEKMLLDLSEEHKEHLAFLPQVDSAVVAEFGRIAVEFLRRGSNPKIYEGAASKKGGGTALKTARRRKLSVSSDTVQHGVEGLIHLLTESSKLM
ncbi:COMM domain-containing protein 2, partial [Eschrichtius robustus]|nr:COMM domain-containing protein 2 [Eschrichtius robustus]